MVFWFWLSVQMVSNWIMNSVICYAGLMTLCSNLILFRSDFIQPPRVCQHHAHHCSRLSLQTKSKGRLLMMLSEQRMTGFLKNLECLPFIEEGSSQTIVLTSFKVIPSIFVKRMKCLSTIQNTFFKVFLCIFFWFSLWETLVIKPVFMSIVSSLTILYHYAWMIIIFFHFILDLLPLGVSYVNFTTIDASIDASSGSIIAKLWNKSVNWPKLLVWELN